MGLIEDSNQNHQKPNLFKPQMQSVEAPTVHSFEDSNQDYQRPDLLPQAQLLEAPTVNLLEDFKQDHQKPDLLQPQTKLVEAPTVHPDPKIPNMNRFRCQVFIVQKKQFLSLVH